MQQKLCPICSAPVLRKTAVYCGMKCYSEARQINVDVMCASCKEVYQVRPYEAKRSRNHYCPSCRDQWATRQPPSKPPTGYLLSCYFCGAPIYRQRWYSKRYLYSFCSKECRSAGWRSLRMAHEGLFGKKP